MKSAVETLTPTRVKLTVEVSADELAPRLDAAYATIKRTVTVPGFRKGKVPNRIIDQRFGRGTVVQEAVNDALGEYYGAAMREHELRPLGQPEVNLTELPLEEGQQLAFDAEVDIVPSFELGDYSAITVEVDPVAADEDDVTTRMDALRARFGTLVGADRPAQDGDFTSIDLRAEVDGEQIDAVESVSYEIGSGTMLDGLDEALIGASPGDTVEFTSALPSGEGQGREAAVTVMLHAVKVRELPELDDDFAQLASEFDTLEELLADLRRQSEAGRRFEQGVQARDKVLDAMLEMTDIPVPDNVVEAEVHKHLEREERLDDDEHRAEVTESTRTAMKTQFLLDALVTRDAIQVEQAEVVEYLVMSAQQSGMNPNDFAKAVDEQGAVPAMVAEVGRRKALATVLETVTVTDTTGAVVDLNAITGDEDDEDELETEDEDELETEDEDELETEDEDELETEDEDELETEDEDEDVEAQEREDSAR